MKWYEKKGKAKIHKSTRHPSEDLAGVMPRA